MKDTRQDKVKVSDIEVGTRIREEMTSVAENMPESFTQLKADIKIHGLIHPIAVKENHEDHDYPYTLLAGGRRLAAVIDMAMEYIEVNIYDSTLSDLDAKGIELAENIVRKSLEFHEEIKLKAEINALQIQIHGEKTSTAVSAPGWNAVQTAALLGESPANLSRDLKLAKAVELLPGLKAAKSKGEAFKMINSMERKATNAAAASVAEEKAAKTPMDQIKKALMNNYILGDFFECVKKVPSNSIGFIELDPPYAIALQEQKRDYESVYVGDNYNEVHPDKYPDFIRLVLEECYRVLRPDGWIVVWFGPDPWFPVILGLMQEIGYKTRGLPGIWNKGTGQTNRPDRYLANANELFFYGTKEDGQIAKQGRSNVFDFKPVAAMRKNHPTERPIELIQELITVFTLASSQILVPFLGSGNTILAGANKCMTTVGFEKVRSYRESFIVNVTQSDPGRYSSYRQTTIPLAVDPIGELSNEEGSAADKETSV